MELQGNKIYLGDVELSKVYDGDMLIWEKQQPVLDYNYLKFTALNDGVNIGGIISDTTYFPNLEYSTNGTTWNELQPNQNVTLAHTGDFVYLKGVNPNGINKNSTTTQIFSFNCKGRTKVSGNIMSIIDGQEDGTKTVPAYGFYRLFNNTDVVDASELQLPATTLATGCYRYMFDTCSSLISAPKILPATKLAQYCYGSMFKSCGVLTTPPKILATSTTSNACSSMFLYNKSITEIELELLNITGISSMFSGCSKLNYVKAMFTSALGTSQTNNWLQNVASEGIFVANINATWVETTERGASTIPVDWTIIYFDSSDNKYYTTQTKEVECDKYGNPI